MPNDEDLIKKVKKKIEDIMDGPLYKIDLETCELFNKLITRLKEIKEHDRKNSSINGVIDKGEG